MIRALFLSLALVLAAAPNASAQETPAAPGAQTLEDILARQEALRDGDADAVAVRGADDRRVVAGGDGADPSGSLGPLNDWSDPGVWRGVRYDDVPMTSQIRGPAATTLIQTGGMEWQRDRAGPLKLWGGLLLLGTLTLLAVFYAFRGRIRIDGPLTGRTLLRFRTYERFTHWLLAGSFLALAITGLLILFGRVAFIPLFGHEAWAPMAIASKWVHNNISWAFMLAVILTFVIWIAQNIPNRDDWQWIKRGGGMLGGGHVPARKFNAGQKMIFWVVILGGASLSLSGLSLLFPFELPMFAKTFGWINATGLPGLFGGEINTALAPQEEMQYAQLWHAIVSFAMIAVIFAHIYLGSVGMQGAYSAMGRGRVEEQWAREHHSIWAEKAIAERDDPRRAETGSPAPHATPAE